MYGGAEARPQVARLLLRRAGKGRRRRLREDLDKLLLRIGQEVDVRRCGDAEEAGGGCGDDEDAREAGYLSSQSSQRSNVPCSIL